MLAASRPPTGALKPPVAVGPSDEEEDFGAGYGYEGQGGWDLPVPRSHPSAGVGVGGGGAAGGWGFPNSLSQGSAGEGAWHQHPDLGFAGDTGRGAGGWSLGPGDRGWSGAGDAAAMGGNGNGNHQCGGGGGSSGNNVPGDFDFNFAGEALRPGSGAGEALRPGMWTEWTGERYTHARSGTRGPGFHGNLEAEAAAVLEDVEVYPLSAAAAAPRQPRSYGGIAALRALPGEGPEGLAGSQPLQQYSRPATQARAQAQAVVLGSAVPVAAAAPLGGVVKIPPARVFQEPTAAHQAKALVVPPTLPVMSQSVAVSPGVLGGSATAKSMRMAEHWAASYAPPSVGRTATMTYPSGTLVNVQELATALAPVAAANALHRGRIVPAIENGDLVRHTLQTYQACDRDLTGYLSWNNGEIRDFISSVFRQQGLSPPNEHQMYQLYAKFDADRNSVLDARECLCLVDALFRATFFSDPQTQAPLPASAPGLAGLGPGPAAAFQGLPASPAWPGPARPNAVGAPGAPVPLPVMGPMGPPQPSQGGSAGSPLQVPPPLAPLHLGGPALGLNGASGAGAGLPRPPGSISAAPGPFGLLGPRTFPGSGTPTVPVLPGLQQPLEDSIPPWEEADMGGMPPMPAAGPPAPLPPAWQHEHEQRPHILDVELEELELHPAAPDMEASWYHSVKYFVSLHPRSENPESIPLPRDAPKATVAGEYLVSKVEPPRRSKVRVGGAPRVSSRDSSDSEEGRGQQPKIDRRNPVVEFRQHMSLNTSRLDKHLVAFVWGKKSSMMDESVTLIGRALAPLHDFNLQRRSTTWGVFDVLASHRVAEMRVRYSVATTPGAVREPTLAEVQQTSVKIVWTPPENDHGAPLLGYRVSIVLEPKAQEEPQWLTLCECTKSLNPVYVVANLSGNRTYVVDVRGVNKVGPGDPCEFQIHTGPVEPEPPSKPWIEEARDGCVNVAWQPPPSGGDGGSPVTAFKVRMRKILGASKWNPFGPGESRAIWVDMGSIAVAANNFQEEGTSMYNAWLGPLETTACEYRFQIVAANSVGESSASELSDPIYT